MPAPPATRPPAWRDMESRQQVLKLGEFHLSFALARLGVLGKNIEDEGGAVDDLGVHDVFKASALGGR